MEKNRSFRRRSFIGAALGLSGIPALAACTSEDGTGGGDPSKPTVMVQVPTLDNTYWADVIKGAEAAGESLGLNVDVQVYGESTDTQLSQVQQAGSKGADMAMVFAQDRAASPTLIQAGTDQGIYVANVFSNASWSTPLDPEFDGYFVGYFTPDNVTDSYNVTKSLLEQIDGSGDVLQITGTPGNTTSTERELGMQMAIEEFPNVKVVGKESGGESRVATQPVIENLLTAHPGVKAVLCHNDDSAIAVINALRDRGLSHVKVGGNDAIEEFLNDMSDGGNAASTVAIHGAWFGGYNVVRLYDAFNEIESYTPGESMMFQDSLTIDTADAASEYMALVYEADTLPFDWKAMSRAEQGDSWDTQMPLIPIDPHEYWGRLEEEPPSGYELPAEIAKYFESDSPDSTASEYIEHAQSSPLSSAIEQTRTGASTLGQR